MAEVDIDVAVIGAGIAGISAAYHIQHSTKLSHVVYEAREEIGGTWSLFRYSGVRSDIDMFSYAFPWRPWTGDVAVAEGWQIKQYLKDASREFGIDKKIQFGHEIKEASWSSADNRWTLTIEHAGETKTVTARFIFAGTGYYNYKTGFNPALPGHENFKGQTISPQFWPDNLSFDGKQTVILGSGATAVSLLPAIAKQVGSGNVTVLQRSPSYFCTIRRTREVTNFFRKWFPLPTARLLRLYSAYLDTLRFLLCRGLPRLSRWYLRREVAKRLPPGVPMDPHFNPSYLPWEQRLCFVPDDDYFQALGPGQGGKIVTGTIKSFTANGIILHDGTTIPCDILAQATGLLAEMGGSIAMTIDGVPRSLGETFWYRACMMSSIPNYFYASGSFFQGYTISAETASETFVKTVRHMQKHGYTKAVPVAPENLEPDTTQYVSSGYILRSTKFPKSGKGRPWQGVFEWTGHWWDLTFGKVDQCMEFS